MPLYLFQETVSSVRYLNVIQLISTFTLCLLFRKIAKAPTNYKTSLLIQYKQQVLKWFKPCLCYIVVGRDGRLDLLVLLLRFTCPGVCRTVGFFFFFFSWQGPTTTATFLIYHHMFLSPRGSHFSPIPGIALLRGIRSPRQELLLHVGHG